MSADEPPTSSLAETTEAVPQCSPCSGVGFVAPASCSCCGGPACTKLSRGDVFFVSLHYKGSAYDVPVMAGEPASQIFDFVQEALDFPRESSRLIHKGRLLRPEDPLLTEGKSGLTAAAKIMLVASSARDVAVVQSSRADPLVKGFEEEERDDRLRRKRAKAAGASAWGTKQDSEYRFGSIKAEFKYNTPTPFDAEKFLQKLATDPGIIDIMKTRQFKVHVLTEMSPDESKERMEKKGTPNMDLLGYNQNYGEKIVLKLRTDNCKGFRPYHDVMNTLLHELTHNVWGPHDHNFWKLFGEIKAQYMRFHSFWSHGGKSASGETGSGGQFAGFAGDDDEDMPGGSGGIGGFEWGSGGTGGFGAALGGSNNEDMPTTDAERRLRALSAAQARVAQEPAPQHQSPTHLTDEGCAARPSADSKAVMPVDKATSAVVGNAAAQDSAIDSMEMDAGNDRCDADHDMEVDDHIPAEADDESRQVLDLVGQEIKHSDADHDMEADAHIPAATADESRQVPDLVGQEISQPWETPDLSTEDLEALGLDGSVVWVSRFSRELDTVCRVPSHVARGAVEILARLVRNVVESPHDTKFRRIRTDNPRLRQALFSLGTGSEELMRLLGFEATTGDGGGKEFLLRDAVMDTGRLLLGRELLEQRLTSIPAH